MKRICIPLPFPSPAPFVFSGLQQPAGAPAPALKWPAPNPFDVPVRGAVRRDFYTSADVLAATTVTLITITTGKDELGRLARFGQGTGTGLFTSTIWDLRINNLPVDDYANTLDQIGTIDVMTDVYIELQENATFTLKATNNSGATLKMAARVIGWFFNRMLWTEYLRQEGAL